MLSTFFFHQQSRIQCKSLCHYDHYLKKHKNLKFPFSSNRNKPLGPGFLLSKTSIAAESVFVTMSNLEVSTSLNKLSYFTKHLVGCKTFGLDVQEIKIENIK